MTFVLDEAPNIAALPSLPTLMTDGGGRGLMVWVIAQSMSQLKGRWGDAGADTIFDGAATKLVLGGGSDQAFLEKLSVLVGQHRVERSSTSYGDGRSGGSKSVSQEWARILRPEEIRELPEGKALLLYRNQRATIVSLPAWFEGKERKAVEASIAAAGDLEGIA